MRTQQGARLARNTLPQGSSSQVSERSLETMTPYVDFAVWGPLAQDCAASGGLTRVCSLGNKFVTNRIDGPVGFGVWAASWDLFAVAIGESGGRRVEGPLRNTEQASPSLPGSFHICGRCCTRRKPSCVPNVRAASGGQLSQCRS